MSLSFSDFKIQEKANTRQAGASYKRGQTYKMRFRRFVADKAKENERVETIFQLSTDLFDSTQLSSVDYGAVQLAGTSYIAVVGRNHATFLKQSEKAAASGNKKGTAFKSTILEDQLEGAGIINRSDDALLGKTQKLDLVKVADNVTIGEGPKAIQALAVYEIVKDSNTDAVNEEEEEEGTVDEEVPQASPFGAISSDEDDF